MAGGENEELARSWPESVHRVRARTPARLLQGRAGAGYLTDTQLDLRAAHAAARDAVRMELDAGAICGAGFWDEWRLFETATRARTKDQYLRYPDLGRRFDEASRSDIARRCAPRVRLQIAIGDGLSVPALAAQLPTLFPLLLQSAIRRGWALGQIFLIRHCRVGILNEIGELLAPDVAVLLIGERPGLATVESLSAYMAYRPHASHTDANRNLISNIHARGCRPAEAAEAILDLAERMSAARLSGWQLKTGDRDSMPATRQADS
jgi:ethanolamine ammonia-lyase small subunit